MRIRCLSWACLILAAGVVQAQNVHSLAGSWRLRLDPQACGETERWFAHELTDRIAVPGTTDLGGYGPPATRTDAGHLVREHAYVGIAWYQRDVEIPAAWGGAQIELFLERVLWTSRVWVDGDPVGNLQDSLTTPHRHRLGKLTPGNHTLTVCIDNSRHVEIGVMGHSYTEETQSIWNGMVGRVELRRLDPVRIRTMRAFPVADAGSLRVEVTLDNDADEVERTRLSASLVDEETSRSWRAEAEVAAPFGASVHSLTIDLGDAAIAPWDEFRPRTYLLEVYGPYRVKSVRVGFRAITRQGRRILVNDRPVFLRGTVECCVFPKTGHPPMDVDSWVRIFSIGKEWGLNHFRFHSWCPPEAAFEAADRLGVYLQPESPTWVEGWMRDRTEARPADFGKDAEMVAFVRAELQRMLDAYGNHPSFCMLTIGNELGGADWDLAAELIADARKRDPRRLYAVSTARELTPADDYYVSHRGPGGTARGLGEPHTDWDFAAAVESVDVPLIAHETGQRPVFPDYRTLERYSGPLRPRNLEPFRDQLAERGMREQNAAFVRASLLWTVGQYRHEIEAILRTADYAGFQLLQLNDFPGQTEALVGLLDPFWTVKGSLAPEEWRRFCGPTVPLLSFPSFVWEGKGILRADARIAHFGPEDLESVTPRWELRRPDGELLGEGDLAPCDIPAGTRQSVGSLTCDLPDVAMPEKLSLSLRVGKAHNSWDLWLFPRLLRPVPPAVVVAGHFDAKTRAALADGKRVLLAPPGSIRNPRVFRGQFHSVFWSAVMFGQPQGTLGVLCDPRHPALAGFPNDGHTDWQWRTLLESSRVFVLDDAPKDYRAIVQPISDFHYNHKLGSVFETRVGAGRLLVCGLNLDEEDPAGRAMRTSLLAYVGSDAFAPAEALPVELLESLFADDAAPLLVEGAALNVSCAGSLSELGRNVPWRPELDRILVARPGYGVELLEGGTWLDGQGHAWHGRPLVFTIRVPPRAEGTLRLHLWDWNDQGRRGAVTVEDETRALGSHTGEGAWLQWKVGTESTADGRLEVRAEPRAGPNLMIAQVVFVPGR